MATETLAQKDCIKGFIVLTKPLSAAFPTPYKQGYAAHS